MVHCDGQADRRFERQGAAGRHAAPSRVRSDRDHPLGAAAGTEPHHRDGREQARLGDLAPARLGVPITVFIREKDDGSVEILNDARVDKRIADAFEQEGADAWYATGAAARFLKPDYDSNESQKVDDILDVWFDSGSTHAFVLEDPAHFPSLAGIGKPDARHRDVSRRIGPASRLVPVFSARVLRHARAGAVRRGAHARLRARRGRAQDVEVAGQRDGATGCDQAIGRRYPADVGVRLGLCRRSAHRTGNPQDHGGNLPQTAQHDSAGCWARWRISARETVSRP